MIGMGISKVDFAGNTLVDLTADTVTPESLLEGFTAHDASGEAIVGVMQAASGSSVTLPEGYTIEMGIYVPESDISSAVTIDLKNTFRWADSGKTSACYLLMAGVDIRTGTQAAALGAHVKFGVGERNHQMVTTSSGCSTSSTVFLNPKSTTTFNAITMTGTGSYPLKKGHSYLWMVIGELAV